MAPARRRCCRNGICDRHRRHNGGLTIDAVSPGDRVRVIRVHGGRRLVHRLAALGIVPGSVVTVARPTGPSIISIGGARIAVGRQAAAAVEVEDTE